MKKIYSLLSVLLVSGALIAQVNVTYMVDVTKYVAAGTPIGAGGLRIGGNFDVTAAMNVATAMPAWSPSNVACAMADKGGNVWSLTVTYPSASVGLTQFYKFVNNDWGTNEGTDVANTIATDGCGVDDGAGNINRSLVIPASDVTLQFCWDACFLCNGNDPDITGLKDLKPVPAIMVFPNPVSKTATIRLNLKNNSEVAISIVNLLGKEVLKINKSRESAGVHSYDLDVTTIPAGIYLYRVVSGGSVLTGNFVKK